MASKYTPPGRFPKQLIVLAPPELVERIERDAHRMQLSKSEVARTYMLAGIALADEEKVTTAGVSHLAVDLDDDSDD